MKIIVPCNNKGGVGKTALSAMLADYCSKILGKRTLLIDLDPQCNISQRFLEMEVDPNNQDGYRPPLHIDYDPDEDEQWNGRSSIADIFFRPQIGMIPYPTVNSNLDILPGHAAELLEVEQCRKNEVVEKIYDRLDSFLSSDDVKEEYDFIIVDTAPSKGPLTKSAMRSATDIIIPTQMEDKPIRGVFGMLQLWAQENNSRPDSKPLKLIGILANMFDARTALHNSLYEELSKNEELGKYLMPCKLSRRIIFAENDTEAAAPRSIFDLPNTDKAKQEAIDVCNYIFNKVLSETPTKREFV